MLRYINKALIVKNLKITVRLVLKLGGYFLLTYLKFKQYFKGFLQPKY